MKPESRNTEDTTWTSEIGGAANDESTGQPLAAIAAASEPPLMAKLIGANDSDTEDSDFLSTQEEEHLWALERASEDYFAEEAVLEARSIARATALSSVKVLLGKPYARRGFLIGPDLLPKGGRMLITGMSGTGNTLTLILAACLTSKKPLFGILDTHKGGNYGEPKLPISSPSEVAYLDYELSDAIRVEKRLRPLVDQFPPEFQTNLFFPKNPSLYRLHNQVGEATGEGSFDALERLVANTRPDVLVIDPLSSTHSLDENSIAIKQALNNVDRLIDLYGCAAIVAHHSTTKSRTDRNGKPIERDPIEEPRGHSIGSVRRPHTPQGRGIADEVEEDDEPSPLKIIELSFGKARHCRKPEKRRLSVDFTAMRVSQLKKKSKITWGSEARPAAPISYGEFPNFGHIT